MAVTGNDPDLKKKKKEIDSRPILNGQNHRVTFSPSSSDLKGNCRMEMQKAIAFEWDM